MAEDAAEDLDGSTRLPLVGAELGPEDGLDPAEDPGAGFELRVHQVQKPEDGRQPGLLRHDDAAQVRDVLVEPLGDVEFWSGRILADDLQNEGEESGMLGSEQVLDFVLCLAKQYPGFSVLLRLG